jgi:hypothetical protein
MKIDTNNNRANKKTYSKPLISTIKLDSEISLAMESAPPGGPSESIGLTSENNCNNPFNNQPLA